jgi:5-oxoprolinase (ATP-hydrolysing) subunit A
MMDFNVDVGEGFDNENAILPFVSSCNIACGSHAGNELIMRSVINLAKKYEIRIGAHPAFEDRTNFGRLVLDTTLPVLKNSIRSQIKLLIDIAKDEGAVVEYIKPHGALYHKVCNDTDYAELMTVLIAEDFKGLSLMGLPNCIASNLCREKGIEYLSEGFADRTYEVDGNLRLRNLEGSVLINDEEVLNQVIEIKNSKVTTYNGEKISLVVNSICFHGDHEGSAERIKFVVNRINEL